jgi:hypothetical protein
MPRAIRRSDSVKVIAAVVSEALRRHGIEAVLSGGAVVSIYSVNEYESHDLDFITAAGSAEIVAAMGTIGFRRERGRHFVHPQTDFIVEFPSGPLMVGEELVRTPAMLRTSRGTIRLLTPTQAVKDRLAGFFHWSDRQSLEQALMIARHQPINLKEVARWATAEPPPALERYRVFEERLKAR